MSKRGADSEFGEPPGGLAALPTNFRERAAFLRENGAAEQAATAWRRPRLR